MEDLSMTDWELNLSKMYMKLWAYICDRKAKMLEPIWLKIDKKQKFYSKTDKKFLYLGPTWKMYLVSSLEDDKGRVLVYAPYLFGQGQLFLVPSELIIRLGYN
jgi:hypothetical protein